MAVYFATDVATGAIKIGVSAWPARRIGSLRFDGRIPEMLAVALVADDYATERALLARFSADRIHGEWFHPSPELLALIDEHRADEAARSTNTMVGDQNERIRVLRKRLKLTQEQFGERIGMHRTNVVHLEAGRRRVWYGDVVSRFARGLGASLEDTHAFLFDGMPVDDFVARLAVSSAA